MGTHRPTGVDNYQYLAFHDVHKVPIAQGQTPATKYLKAGEQERSLC